MALPQIWLDEMAALRASVMEANSKMDLILVLIDSLRAGGTVVTPEDVQALSLLIAEVSVIVDELKAKEDQALA